MNLSETLIVIALIFGLAVWGFICGQESGQKRACESVKLEWVKDKCMKVAREAV